MHKKRVAVIGGGTGTFTALSGLKRYPLELTAIVAMADDGGSTGVLRDELGVLPPGDIRRALVALSDSSETLRALFNHRFENGGLRGHSFGNLFLAALEQVTGSFEAAVREASKVLKVRGAVIPVTLNRVRLRARLEDGTFVRGETAIDIPRGSRRARIARAWLTPAAYLNPRARAALRAADVIILGPGDLYTSIIPNLLVRGVPEAIRRSRAKKLYIVNVMTKPGETDGFRAADFVRVIQAYLGKGVLDTVVLNRTRPPKDVLRRYARKGSAFVAPIGIASGGRRPECRIGNLLDRGAGRGTASFLRHDSDLLARFLMRIMRGD